MVAPLFQDRVYVEDFPASGFDRVVGDARDIAATLTLADYEAEGAPAATDLQRLATPLTESLTAELDGAAAHLGVLVGKLLLAALGRAVARTIGSGVVAVDVDAHTIALDCLPASELDATGMLGHVCAALTGSTVRQPDQPPADLAFRCAGPAATEEPLPGHALQLHASRRGGVVDLQWWFDARRFEAYTVEELAEQFPQALIEITSEAIPGFTDAD
ncbi:hypothetical protein L2K20_03035 [Mycobacterium sp. MBM]|nr:hypothetical protein [Mycobacterium sp. MBM]